MKVSRLKLSIIAGVYGQVITTIIALGSLPLFLNVWTVEQYGIWIVLSTLPAYIASLDIGVASVLSNQIFLKKGTNRNNYSSKLFSTALVFVLILLLLTMCLLVIFIPFLPENYTVYNKTILLLACWGGLSLFNPFIDLFFRLKGDFYTGIFVLNTQRLFEWLFSLVALVLTENPLAVAWTLLVTKLIIYLVSFSILYCKNDHFQFGKQFICFGVVKKYLDKSVRFSLFPISNAITIQGLTYVVFTFLGAEVVVIYNVYRTLTRTLTQGLTIMNKAYWPEFTEAFSNRKFQKLNQLIKSCRQINVILGVSLFIIMMISGETIIFYWTTNKIPFEYGFYGSMMLVVLITSFWQPNWVLLMALNKHSGFAIAFFRNSIITILLSVALISFLGKFAIPLSLVIYELLMYLDAKKHSYKEVMRIIT